MNIRYTTFAAAIAASTLVAAGAGTAQAMPGHPDTGRAAAGPAAAPHHGPTMPVIGSSAYSVAPRHIPAVPKPVRPIASPLENQLAANDAINLLSLGLSGGTVLGTIAGGVLGVGIGLALAGASCAVISLGCVVAVMPLMTAGGAAGAIVGLGMGGGGSLLGAAYTYATTMLAPPGHSVYASQIPGLERPAPRPAHH